jgi:hypothetical protein
MNLAILHIAVCPNCHKAFLMWGKFERLPTHEFSSDGQTCSHSGLKASYHQTFGLSLKADPKDVEIKEVLRG